MVKKMKKNINRKTRLVPIIIITAVLFTVVISTDLVSAASGKAYSVDIDLGMQYIIPTDGFKVVQEVEYENQGTGDLLIDSFTVTQIGSAANSLFKTVEIWEDGGNGYYDRGGIGRPDDTLIYSFDDPNIIFGSTFGMNDNNACLVVPQDSSKKVFVTVDVNDGIAYNESIILELSAEDLVNSSSVQWATGEGVETATSSTNIFAKASHTSRYIADTNDNGIADQIIWNHFYPIGPATKLDHNVSEASTIEKFTVEYNENEVDILGIELYETNNENRASFVLLLDEGDPDLQLDTTSIDFSCSYDSTGEELSFENAIGQSVPVWPSPLFPIIDGVGPVVTSLTVSDEMITNVDVGDTFEVVLTFSESMHTESFPVLDFDGAVHEGSSQMLIVDSQNWIDENTFQINYTIADEQIYAGNIDVICTTEGVYDVDAYGDSKNQMNSSYTEADLFTIDTKAPDISGFPTDTLTPGQDYTIRIKVSDNSDIQNVLLDYDFGTSWNTKTMSYNPGSDEYFAVVTTPNDATLLRYKISAYDIYDNGEETSVKELLVDEEGDDDEDDDEDDQDTDEDGYPDDMEESYATNATDATDYPLDTDEDGIPDDDSGDGKYTGDTDDDGDKVPDEIENLIGSDAKDGDDVTDVDDLNGYLIDTTGDGKPDSFYEKTDETVTNVSIDDAGDYQIDVDGDGTIDYLYDDTTGTTTPNEEEKTVDSTPGFTMAFVFIAMAAMIIVFLIFIRRPRF